LFEVWRGNHSRAWDGSGHESITRLYAQSIFPDSCGWTNAYFGGMPFPNFYPPVFYWCIGFLERLPFVSFETAFKLMVSLPTLFMPVVLWWLTFELTKRNRIAATTGALASLFLLLDQRSIFSLPAGLDYFSTFQIGLYTQPLGFVLLIAWYVSYQRCAESCWRFLLSSLLLALAVLTNFFAGATAALFAVVTIAFDAGYLFLSFQDARSSDESKGKVNQEANQELFASTKRQFLVHLLSPLIALLLTLFWVVPMLNQYQYFVTRPYVIETGLLVSSAWWIWFALALIGSFVWIIKPTRTTLPYLTTCFLLAVLVVFAAVIAPRWFPLQSPRFLAMLNFLLVVPVGQTLSAGFRLIALALGEISAKENKNIKNNKGNKDKTKKSSQTISEITFRHAPYTTGVAIAILIVLVISSPGTRSGAGYAFMAKGEKPEIEQILNFAKQHTDGRYIVEVINPQLTPAYSDASFDARAVNAYLGSQGNETLSIVFHEASPNSLFMLPATNSLSNYPDSFGISSVLADDKDFAAQPLSIHIQRARMLGVKYLVIRTPNMKEKLAKENGIANKYDFGWWTVFELNGDIAPATKILPYEPALVVSSFTLKARYRNELNFVRLAEEQFNDNWFDVLLVRSQENKIDRLQDLENFGALIIDLYDSDDENNAFEKLKTFAQNKTLILLASESSLFNRIKTSQSEFPKLTIIERLTNIEKGEMMNSLYPTYSYKDHPIRQQWALIRQALDKEKIAVDIANAQTSIERNKNLMSLSFSTNTQNAKVPILLSTTFHPRWRRTDGETIYSATPFYMLTFTSKPVQFVYERNGLEKAALWLSLFTLIGLCGFVILPRFRFRLSLLINRS
jgi:hypothetical protein